MFTFESAARDYLDKLADGDEPIYRTGIAPLDASIGGIAAGETAIVAARPGVGKTLFGIQVAVAMAAEGVRVAYLSEEMTARAMGKRMIHHATSLPADRWKDAVDDVYADLDAFWERRVNVLIPAGKCRTFVRACEVIELLVQRHQIEVVFVDYLQRLRGAGTGRYEEVTGGSIALANAAVEHGIALICLAQLNRQTDSQDRAPKFCDLRDSGQIEQDADVILFLDWPLKRKPSHKPPFEYWIYCAKNRNRPIGRSSVELRIEPGRQMLTEVPFARIEAFDNWNDS